MSRIVITGAAGFIGSHLSETLLDRGHRVIGIDNLLTGDTANIAHLPGGISCSSSTTSPTTSTSKGRSMRAALGEPGEPDRLPRAADSHAEGRRARHAQGARPGEGQERAVRDRLDVGGLRRSARTSAEGNLLGQRQPDRSARRLRRSQAVCRGDDDGLSPVSRRRYEDRPHLQHLRTADAAAGRPRRAGVHEPGADRTKTSRSSATASRPAASATSATWWTASFV